MNDLERGRAERRGTHKSFKDTPKMFRSRDIYSSEYLGDGRGNRGWIPAQHPERL
jgi:hypothetical protein